MRQPPKASPSTPSDVKKLANVLEGILGKGTINIPGEQQDYMIKRIKAWFDVGRFNEVLGHEAFGIPCGYYMEIAGGESAGKSTLAYALIAWAQKAGFMTFLADVEHSYDEYWANLQGLDPKSLIIIESTYEGKGGEYKVDHVDQQFTKFEAILKKSWELYRKPQLLVIDSLAALLPKEQLEGEFGERSVGALARALAVNLPKFQPVMIDTSCACIIINQLRDKIGVMFGEKETTPGGRAKNFYFSSRVSVKRISSDKKGGVVVGITSRISNKKNKLGPPFRTTEFQINFKTGIQ